MRTVLQLTVVGGVALAGALVFHLGVVAGAVFGLAVGYAGGLTRERWP